MAFHVACPLTCRRICDCELGFPPGMRGEAFLEEITALDDLLRDSWIFPPAAEEVDTVQVWVPRVVVEDGGGGAVSDDVNRAGRKRQKLVASLGTEGFVRSLEDGGATDVLREGTSTRTREDKIDKILCCICFSEENEESQKAEMLPCKSCNKKYHRSCMKLVAEHRDLFNWSSWSCPSCRICEVCRKTGDPNKLMYCKRCDDAYHCYCQHPPHKNVGRGPYLCPKHTRCYSCRSIVPGSGLSTRWFLSYTCCDACGRLFVKGNYCPICLKVYRDSEPTPMVCCDVCEKWVHCGCDGISDKKYRQYQTDKNLQYSCAACRGDCYQVKNIDDAVRELWKRKDIADHDLIANLQTAAGFQQEINLISPCLKDETKRPIVLRNNNSKTVKFSLNDIQDESSEELGKIVSNKKHTERGGCLIKFDKTVQTHLNLNGHNESGSSECSFNNGINTSIPYDPNILSASTEGTPNSNAVTLCTNELDSFDHNMAKEAASNNADTVPMIKVKSSKLQGLHPKEYSSKGTNGVEIAKIAKLVIHTGPIKKNAAPCSTRSEASSHIGEDLNDSSGDGSPKHRRKDDISRVKFRNVYEKRPKGNSSLTSKTNAETKVDEIGFVPVKESMEQSDFVPVKESMEQSDNIPEKEQNAHTSNKSSRENNRTNFASSFSDDPKPSLKPKFKNPFCEQWAPLAEETSVTGLRTKRKRPSTGKWGRWQDEVESSNSSWRTGMTVDACQGTSLSSCFEDGRSTNLESGSQLIRFISQKKRARKD